MPRTLSLIALSISALLALVLLARRVRQNPWGDIPHGLIYYLGRGYLRLVHRPRVRGEADLLRRGQEAWPDGLIIVCNHTAGIDPMLVQGASNCPIRWVMAEDMRIASLEWLWRMTGVIFVDRSRGGAASLREAVRHVKGGGILGIFPEGGLERPPERVRPFGAGVGWLIRKTRAPVVPVVIQGTPRVDPAWASLWRRSRSVLTVHPVVDYSSRGMDDETIAADLRGRFLDFTGWPANDELASGAATLGAAKNEEEAAEGGSSPARA